MSFVGDAEAIAQRLTVTRAQPSKVLSLFSAVLIVLWIIVTVFFFYVVVVTVKRHIPRPLMLFHGGVAWLFGIRIHIRGELATDGSVLYVSDHVSYLDVFILGAKLPASFIAKEEVAGWRVFGSLAKYQNTFFFERNKRRAAAGKSCTATRALLIADGDQW